MGAPTPVFVATMHFYEHRTLRAVYDSPLNFQNACESAPVKILTSSRFGNRGMAAELEELAVAHMLDAKGISYQFVFSDEVVDDIRLVVGEVDCGTATEVMLKDSTGELDALFVSENIPTPSPRGLPSCRTNMTVDSVPGTARSSAPIRSSVLSVNHTLNPRQSVVGEPFLVLNGVVGFDSVMFDWTPILTRPLLLGVPFPKITFALLHNESAVVFISTAPSTACELSFMQLRCENLDGGPAEHTFRLAVVADGNELKSEDILSIALTIPDPTLLKSVVDDDDDDDTKIKKETETDRCTPLQYAGFRKSSITRKSTRLLKLRSRKSRMFSESSLDDALASTVKSAELRMPSDLLYLYSAYAEHEKHYLATQTGSTPPHVGLPMSTYEELCMDIMLTGKITDEFMQSHIKQLQESKVAHMTFSRFVSMMTGTDIIGLELIKRNYESFGSFETHSSPSSIQQDIFYLVAMRLAVEGRVSLAVMEQLLTQVDRNHEGVVAFDEYFELCMHEQVRPYANLLRLSENEIITAEILSQTLPNAPPAIEFQPDPVSNLYALFCRHDRKKTGEISLTVLMQLLSDLSNTDLQKNNILLKEFAKNIISEMGQNQVETVTFAELLSAITTTDFVGVSTITSNFESYPITHIFGHRCLTADVLKDLCNSVVEKGKIPRDVMDNLFTKLDSDNDGLVTFGEFFDFMRQPGLTFYAGLIRMSALSNTETKPQRASISLPPKGLPTVSLIEFDGPGVSPKRQRSLSLNFSSPELAVSIPMVVATPATPKDEQKIQTVVEPPKQAVVEEPVRVERPVQPVLEPVVQVSATRKQEPILEEPDLETPARHDSPPVVDESPKLEVPPKSPISAEQESDVAWLAQQFTKYDTEHTGTIATQHLLTMLTELTDCERMTAAQVDECLQRIPEVEFITFCELVTIVTRQHIIGLNTIKTNFDSFPSNGSAVSLEALRLAFSRLVMLNRVNEEAIDELITTLDADGDGYVTFDEYIVAVMSDTLKQHSNAARIFGSVDSMAVAELDPLESAQLKLQGEDMTLIYLLFSQFQTNRQGQISRTSLTNLLGELVVQNRISEDIATECLKQLSNEVMSFEEVVAALTGTNSVAVGTIKDHFESFGVDSSSMTISSEALAEVCLALVDKDFVASDDMLDKLSYVDMAQTGGVTFGEFFDFVFSDDMTTCAGYIHGASAAATDNVTDSMAETVTEELTVDEPNSTSKSPTRKTVATRQSSIPRAARQSSSSSFAGSSKKIVNKGVDVSGVKSTISRLQSQSSIRARPDPTRSRSSDKLDHGKPNLRKVESQIKLLMTRTSRPEVEIVEKQSGSVLSIDSTKARAGKFDIGTNKQVFIKVVGKLMVVRTGGGWTEIQEWFRIHFEHDNHDLDVSDVFGVPAPKGAAGARRGSVAGGRRGSTAVQHQPITVRDVLSADKVLVEEPKRSRKMSTAGRR
eukprot:c7196_g1_i1.p1 GENE.c7196_g1_i1~~c7196_g1_i1.p1  ORF type:complete len:1473 (+),score=431.09 c7196_g1_i1:83-4420(+)